MLAKKKKKKRPPLNICPRLLISSLSSHAWSVNSTINLLESIYGVPRVCLVPSRAHPFLVHDGECACACVWSSGMSFSLWLGTQHVGKDWAVSTSRAEIPGFASPEYISGSSYLRRTLLIEPAPQTLGGHFGWTLC